MTGTDRYISSIARLMAADRWGKRQDIDQIGDACGTDSKHMAPMCLSSMDHALRPNHMVLPGKLRSGGRPGDGGYATCREIPGRHLIRAWPPQSLPGRKRRPARH